MRSMDTDDDFTGPVNIGNPGEFTILELAEKVIAAIGNDSKIVNMRCPMTIPHDGDRIFLWLKKNSTGNRRSTSTKAWSGRSRTLTSSCLNNRLIGARGR